MDDFTAKRECLKRYPNAICVKFDGDYVCCLEPIAVDNRARINLELTWACRSARRAWANAWAWIQSEEASNV